VSDDTRTRLDRWLWYARFFKTRSLARQAVEGGRVHVGGARVKPGRAVRIGDLLEIQRGEERYEVTVRALGERRGPATEAQGLYAESEASVARRTEEAAQRRALSASEPRGGRPDKRDRRRLRAFRESQE
jgi:ribosome-associated heat shock protein Hsp15